MSKIRQEKTLSLWQAERDQAHERLEKASKPNGAECTCASCLLSVLDSQRKFYLEYIALYSGASA